MAQRSVRAEIARQTVEILNRGTYSLPDGSTVSIAEPLKHSCENTVLYRPTDFADVFTRLPSPAHPTSYQVVNSTTLAAARSLVEEDATRDVLCLNFASAKNAGGGFLNGSQAQEESLARATGLYACISPVRGYYDANKMSGTALYTHHMIYSPRVPVFRDDDDQLLAEPYLASMLTAPACNAGAMRKNAPKRGGSLAEVMAERIERLLAVAALHGHETLVLGAWGCGVFRNDPAHVAGWFYDQLTSNPRCVGMFRTVVFAVLDTSAHGGTIRPFTERFGV